MVQVVKKTGDYETRVGKTKQGKFFVYLRVCRVEGDSILFY